MSKLKEVVLGISDTQFPFAHKDTFEFLQAVKEKYQPTQVIHIGDELDFHALSNYDHDPDGSSAGDEFKLAMKDMNRLYEIFPTVKACLSNHTARPYRRAFKFGIPRGFMREYQELLKAPGSLAEDGTKRPGDWQWAQKWEIDGVRYEHGEGMAGKYAHIRAAEQNMQSTVMGHLHSNAGIGYVANPRFLIFGMALGCLMDKDAYAAAYGVHLKSKPILGVGIVDKGIPTYVPMMLKKGGRWEGKL